MRKNQTTIAIVSNCMDDWGGSEELWARSIPVLQSTGIRVVLLKKAINRNHPQFIKLSSMGVLLSSFGYRSATRRFLFQSWNKIRERIWGEGNWKEPRFAKKLSYYHPDLVVIAQGINFDGLTYASDCSSLNIPYVIIAQKAVDFFWPYHKDRSYMAKVLREAAKCFFVSYHNLRLTEEQFGERLVNAEVVYNPVKVLREPLQFPSTGSGYRLACIARYFIIDKGQDILLRILSKQKWKERPITVSFIGTGTDYEGLKSMAGLLQVTNIEFVEYANDIQKLWESYHALVLPSRSEGMPLAVIEAMALGRPVIVTKAGGNPEMIQDEITGFIGQANEDSFEDALERAWMRRNEWEAIGKNASVYISENIPESPETEFANKLCEIIYG